MPFCSPFRQSLRTKLARDFYNTFGNFSNNRWYLGIARSFEWASDTSPPANIDSVDEQIQFWRELLSLKRISRTDVSLVITRHDWNSGTIYTPYDHRVDLYDDQIPAVFYVLVEDTRVYKCIDNNNGAQSTVAPTHTDSSIRTLTDGYRWKYLYSISDSQRKFLTQDYLPVRHIDFNLLAEDNLQYSIQQDAHSGAIDFINITNTGTTFPYAILSQGNQTPVAVGVSAGATSFQIAGPYIIRSNDVYNNYVIKIESGPGEGQQRVISDYTVTGNYGTVYINNPLDVALMNDGGSNISSWSILPQVKITGDGSSRNNTLNSQNTQAEATAKISSGTTAGGLIESIELIDSGKNYTYAIVEVLPVGSGVQAEAIISPPGGHGSDPVDELGASQVMISISFEGQEQGDFITGNDYRRFGLVLNPQLNSNLVRLRLFQPSITSDFTVGSTAVLTGSGYTFASGTVFSWKPSSYTGSSELVLESLTGGSWVSGATANSLLVYKKIAESRYLTNAGDEGRIYNNLVLSPTRSTQFSGAGTEFLPRKFVFGQGNTSQNISPSRSNAEIYQWTTKDANRTQGTVKVEYQTGTFKLNEKVGMYDYDYGNLTSDLGKIIAQYEDDSGVPDSYDCSYHVVMQWDGLNYLTQNSFELDMQVVGTTGYPSVTSFNGYASDWILGSGTTGTTGSTGMLKLTYLEGSLVQGLTAKNSQGYNNIVQSIAQRPEILYNSGDALYIQNIKPILRDTEQKEEIKIVIGF